MSTKLSTTPGTIFGPYVVKQRPAGDWVIDQTVRVNGETGVRRLGNFETEREAREMIADLVKEGK